jgi:hypothetical protein
MVNHPNYPELGVGVFETAVPFYVDWSLSGCSGLQDYGIQVIAILDDAELELGLEPIEVSSWSASDTLFSSVNTGEADEVVIKAKLFHFPSGFVQAPQQTPPVNPPGGELKDQDSISESINKFRASVLDLVPGSLKAASKDYIADDVARDSVEKIIRELVNEGSIINEIQVEEDITLEQAQTLYNQRFESAVAALEGPLKPEFQKAAEKLFYEERAIADVRVGATDPAEPKSKLEEGFGKIRDAIEAGVEQVPDLGIDWDIQLASASTILDSAAGQKLSDYLKGDASQLAGDLFKADWEKVPFIQRINASMPVDVNLGLDDLSVDLGVEEVSLQGPKRYKLGGHATWDIQILGRQFEGFLTPGVQYEPEDPSDPTSLGKPEWNLDFGATIRN